MSSIMKLTAVAMTIISLANGAPNDANAKTLRVTFRRFSQPGCTEHYHIAKDTHLKAGHCKTFGKDEPPFESFKVEGPEKGNWHNKKCSAIAYDQPKCVGNAFTMDDFEQSAGACGNWQAPGGRSVFIRCEDRPKPAPLPVVISTIQVIPTPFTTITSQPNDVTTVTSTVPHTTSTSSSSSRSPPKTHTVLVHAAPAPASSRTMSTVTKAITPLTTITMMPAPAPTSSVHYPHCSLKCAGDDEVSSDDMAAVLSSYLGRNGY
ncbi:hypothetical protein BAUCODRAFT_392489 [Baudoinia panamericana UAMH 10762]|uniref:AA1-like domain-containing protein n=1 Tax=Baudoinia panamericana (strain UAMH 10762) TaxID=717646 RepID=M2MQP4_BAUPA|nr:uncharacterized protein BAUCODRAFT_392489 [Baudoinia panamericana UAMH 10762]EMC99126.1 hypothetical protein BAUCODRAFT_392489 [Baudoinia panamericana UAMH 10762]